MIGRILAWCGWLAWQVGRPFRATPLRRLGAAPVVVIAGLLAIAAAVPIVVPLLDAQPEDATAQQLFDHATEHPGGWLRLQGRIQPLHESPTGERGRYALLVDAVNPLRAVVLRGEERFESEALASVSGIIPPAVVLVNEELPIEATVAGTPPRIVPDQMLALDPVAKPARQVPWWLSIVPALLAVALLVGVRTGYPIFRPTSEIDVVTGPLNAGERVPSVFGGRIGTVERGLADPGSALLLVRQGPNGNMLTAQPLSDDGGIAPQPVLIGGSWTNGRVGAVYTRSETVPALRVRSELVDATFLFARSAERDRVAALVTVER